jgi:hypothetical protein
MLKDRDIREGLFDFLEDKYGKIRIFEEKTIGRTRADVVMVTRDAIYGIEIKSDADTYVRLKRQIKDYNRFYDMNYVVVGTSHAMHITEHVPEFWGIITVEEVDGILDFYVLRHPTTNPLIELPMKLSILWRPELAHIQEINEMPKYKDKSKAFVIDKILAKIPDELLRVQICEELFQRDYDSIGEVIKEYRRVNGRGAKKTGKRAVKRAVRKKHRM